MSRKQRARQILPAALCGVLAALAGMAAGHLVAAGVSPAASPVLAVGSTVIDLTPTPLKEWAIAHFGTNDKLVLLGSVTIVTIIVAALAGALARRHRLIGVAFLLVLTGLAAVAALARPVAAPVNIAPAVGAAVVGIAVLLGLLHLLGRPEGRRSAGERSISPDVLPVTARPTSHDGRRQFLAGAAGVTVGAAAAGVLGQRLAAAEQKPTAALPKPADPAGSLPTGLETTVPGVSPLRTPTGSFYRVDTALTIPRVDASGWQLHIDGAVDSPFTLTYAQLLDLPMIERDITMTCVSNEVGGSYVGSARWLGVRVSDLLERARARDGPDQLLSTAVDGFTISSPLGVFSDGRDAMVAIAMNGKPLPAVHGYPARLVTPGLYGFVGATKWLTRLTLTTYAAEMAYWTKQGWHIDAPIKTASRIDTPRPSSRIKAGRTAIGGVAWAQHRGIRHVQVSVDDGDWQDARLGPDVGLDYWRQWWLPWDATKGRHSLRVRATDGTGRVQTSKRADPYPGGSSGIQDVVVFVQ